MKYLAILFIVFSTAYGATAQNVDTATVWVDGVCGMCQDRIENAAYIKGVKKADWDKETKTLTVVFNPKKVSLSDIEKSIAAAGHDTANFTADESAYQKVHSCCRYREAESH